MSEPKPPTRFKPGDRARVIAKESKRYGVELTITSNLVYAVLVSKRGAVWAWVHEVGLPRSETGRLFAYRPQDLAPIYDGNQKVSWSSCAWQPRSSKMST